LLSLFVGYTARADRLELVSNALPELVSDTAGQGSTLLAASSDARWVVFASSAPNLVSGQIDTNQADDVFLYDRDSGSVTLVSHLPGAAASTGNGLSGTTASISADGRYVAFLSQARNLVSGLTDNNGGDDVFLFDRDAGTVSLVSRAAGSATQTPSSNSAEPAISADGNFIAFQTSANNVVTGVTDTNSTTDIFLYNRSTGVTTLVSRSAASATTAASAQSTLPSISADGSWVAYVSRATNLVTGATDTNNVADAFLWERATGTARIVSRASTAATTTGNGAVAAVRIGPDGSFAVFRGAGSNHVTSQSDTNGSDDLFLFDRATSLITLVTRRGTSNTTTPSFGLMPDFTFSADGAWVAFATSATNVLNIQTERNTDVDVFLFSRSAGAVSLVSRFPGTTTTTSATAGSNVPFSMALSADGRWLAYASPGTELVSGQADTNVGFDVFLFDRVAGTNALVSGAAGSATATANNTVRKLVMSSDGGRIAYTTAAWNTVSGVVDTNGADDLLVWDKIGNSTVVASRRDPSLPSASAGGDSTLAPLPGSAVSADGRYVVFLSTAGRLVPGQVDANNIKDVFLQDRTTGVTTVVSRVAGTAATTAGSSLNQGASFATISADGRWIAFTTDAAPLIPGMTDGNSSDDVFLYDRVTGDLRLLSRSPGAAPGALVAIGGSLPMVSADGSYVAFVSKGSLVSGMSDPQTNSNDVFLYTRSTDSFTLVSHRAAAVLTAAGGATNQQISGDGRFVTFFCNSLLVVPGQTGSTTNDLFLWDRTTNTNVLVSHTAASVAETAGASAAALSADGNWIAFVSDTNALVSGVTDTNSVSDVFLYERATAVNRLVSHTAASGTTAGNGGSATPVISADGSWVGFTSSASNLVATDTSTVDVFLYERATAANRKLANTVGATNLSLSADGRRAAFTSTTATVIPGQVDTNNARDVFLADRDTGEVRLASRSTASPLQTGNAAAQTPILSGDGETVIFESAATDLAAADRNIRNDVFAYVVEAAADLTVALTDAPDPVDRGGTLTYGATVTNAGPGGATNVTATVGLPAGAVFVGAAGTGWTCGELGGTVTCTRPSLSVGAAPAVAIQVTVPVARGIPTLTATAAVTSSTPDPVPSNNGASTATAVVQPGITVSPVSGLVTTEAGGTATFAVVLTSAPLADVTIAVASSDPAEGAVTPPVLTFTASDWNLPHAVLVTGVNDDYDDGNVAFTVTTGAAVSTDTGYAGINPADVSVTNEDDDAVGIVVTPTSGLTTTEAGGTATFTVVLASRPRADVTIALTSSDTGEVTVAPSSLTFTTDDWRTAKTVTVTGVDDDYDDGNASVTITTGAAVSTDTGYAGINPADVAVTNEDDDAVGIVVTPTSGLTTTEAGGTASFTVVLASRPRADVTIALTSSNTDEATVSPASLTFTASDWSTPKTVTVTGVDDDDDDGNASVTITTGAAVSADTGYSGIDPADVAVTNEDDDAVGIVVTPTRGLITTEAGGTATFTVVLASRPRADVTIALTSSNTDEATVSPASLTFTTSDWSTAKTVTVTGVNDDYDDGNASVTITTGAAVSTDTGYAGLDPADVAVTNEDDDTSAIEVSPTSGLVTTEMGGTATFTVTLHARPSTDVTIALESSDPDEGRPSPASLTFTTDNWATGQAVTVTGQDDHLRDGDAAYTIVLHPAQSGDPAFDGIDPADVAATNRDDSYEGVFYTVTPCRLIDTRQPGYGPALANNQVAIVQVTGGCGIPSTAQAVAVNLTFSDASQPGEVLAYPGDLVQPPVPELLWVRACACSRSLGAILPLGADGTLAILPRLKLPALNPTVHVILDISGYFE
jgi:hypothetical protein